MYKPSTRVQTLLALYKSILEAYDGLTTPEERKTAADAYKALYRELVRDNPEFTQAEINGWIMQKMEGE